MVNTCVELVSVRCYMGTPYESAVVRGKNIPIVSLNKRVNALSVGNHTAITRDMAELPNLLLTMTTLREGLGDCCVRNGGLGCFRDDPELISNALKYIQDNTQSQNTE